MGVEDDFNDLQGKRPSGRVLKNVGELVAIIQGGSSELMRRLELRAMQTLVSATPVDTGHARSGWTPSVGSAVSDALELGSKKSETRRNANSRLRDNRAKAKAIAETYQLKQGTVFISNNVPYVVFLDQGSSAQAPANFIERALVAAIVATEKSKKRGGSEQAPPSAPPTTEK